MLLKSAFLCAQLLQVKEANINWPVTKEEMQWIASKMPNIHTLHESPLCRFSVKCVKHLIRQLIYLKNIDIMPTGDPAEWAELINAAIVMGRPSFGHCIIEYIPQGMLRYKRQMYSLPQ